MNSFNYISDVMLINTYTILNYFNLSSYKYKYKDKEEIICLSTCDTQIL